MELIPNIKIWLTTPERESVVGSGRCRLLKAIEENGSLAAAAEQLNISYRKAWGDLKKAEQHVGKKLILKNRGGSSGGKTVLTPEGSKLLKGYMEFVADVERYTRETYDKRLKEMIERSF